MWPGNRHCWHSLFPVCYPLLEPSGRWKCLCRLLLRISSQAVCPHYQSQVLVTQMRSSVEARAGLSCTPVLPSFLPSIPSFLSLSSFLQKILSKIKLFCLRNPNINVLISKKGIFCILLVKRKTSNTFYHVKYLLDPSCVLCSALSYLILAFKVCAVIILILQMEKLRLWDRKGPQRSTGQESVPEPFQLQKPSVKPLMILVQLAGCQAWAERKGSCLNLSFCSVLWFPCPRRPRGHKVAQCLKEVQLNFDKPYENRKQ